MFIYIFLLFVMTSDCYGMKRSKDDGKVSIDRKVTKEDLSLVYSKFFDVASSKMQVSWYERRRAAYLRFLEKANVVVKEGSSIRLFLAFHPYSLQKSVVLLDDFFVENIKDNDDDLCAIAMMCVKKKYPFATEVWLPVPRDLKKCVACNFDFEKTEKCKGVVRIWKKSLPEIPIE